MKSIMRLLIDEIKNIIEDTVVPVISVLTGPSNKKKKNSSKERRIQGGVQGGVQDGDILSPLYSPLYRYSKEGNEIEEKPENGFI
jgi:hypothetical protein|tara:strand:- start:103 stop:357 length:255 start_codon:yes stop_codon:yes gene_type:complete